MADRVNSFHIDQALTEFSLQLPVEQGMIQDLVCPRIRVAKETDKYWVFGREELKNHQTHRADGAEAHELEWSVSTATYACDEYALKSFVTQREMANADDPIRPKMEATEKIVRAIRVDRERRVAALVQSTSTWTGSTTPSTKWNASGADPESDITAAIEAFMLQSGALPNTAVINDKVRNALVTWLRAQPGGISLSEWRSVDRAFTNAPAGPDPVLAGFCGIPNWYVGQQLYDSGRIGATASLARVWGDHCTLMYVEPSPGMKKASALYCFENRGMQVVGWDVPSRRGEYVEAGNLLVEKAISADLGYHIYTTLS